MHAPPQDPWPQPAPRTPPVDTSKRNRNVRILILLAVLLGAGLVRLRLYLLENWTPDWSQDQLVSVQILVPPNLDEDEQALIEDLDQLSFADEGLPTFTALSDWFLSEQGRYGVERPGMVPVHLSVAGPTQLGGDPVAPPLGDEPFLDRLSKTNAFIEFYTRHRQPSPAPNTIYLIFYRRSTHPEFAKIHSVADRRSRSGFVFASLDSGGMETAVINAGHELLHLFGASDKYEGETCQFPTGFVEPFREPRYPQRFAEVMAQGIPRGPSQREATISSFAEARIGVQTAYEIGWIDAARRERYYGGDASAAPALEGE